MKWIFCFFLFVIGFTSSQEVLILDENNNPIPNVALFNENRTISTLSNIGGEVNISRFKNNELIYIQHPLYQSPPIQKETILLTNKISVYETVYTLPDIYLNEKKNTDNIKNSSEKKIFITREEINKLNTENIAELLETKGGISVQKSQFGGGSPNIRGFEANKILLVLDGVRLNNAIYRSGHLQNIISIDESILEDVAVIFGPSSVLYGSDALGGTIHMKTKNLYFKNNPEFKTNFFTRYASGYNGFSSHFSFNYQSKRFSIFNGITSRDYGDLKMGENRTHGYENWGKIYHYEENGIILENPDLNTLPNTGYQQLDWINKMMFKINDYWRLTSNIQYSTTSNVPRFDKLNDVNYDNGICEICGTLAPKYLYWYYGPQNRFFSSLNLQGFKKNKLFNRAEFIVSYQQVTESRNQQKIEEDSLTIREEVVDIFSFNTNFKKGNFSYGSESIINLVDSESNLNELNLGATRYPNGGSLLFSSALYINYFKHFSEKFQIEAGVRSTFSKLEASFTDSLSRDLLAIEGTTIKSDNHILSGNIKFSYYPNNSWKISSVTSKGFHSPNIDDMGKLFVKGDNLTIPNPGLKPEYAYSQELSISKQITNDLLTYGTAFYTHIESAIIKDTMLVNLNASNPQVTPVWVNQIPYEGVGKYTFANQNIGSAIIYGATLGLEATIFNNYKIYSDINFTNSKNEEGQSPLAHIPPTFGKILIEREIGKFQFSFDIRYALKKNANEYDDAGVDNLEESPISEILYSETGEETIIYAGAPKWETINLNCNYTINNKISLQLSLNNLLDKHYKVFASGISAPGRSFVITLRIKT